MTPIGDGSSSGRSRRHCSRITSTPSRSAMARSLPEECVAESCVLGRYVVGCKHAQAPLPRQAPPPRAAARPPAGRHDAAHPLVLVTRAPAASRIGSWHGGSGSGLRRLRDSRGLALGRRRRVPGERGVGRSLRARRRVARPLSADPRRGQRGRAPVGQLRRPAPRHARRPPLRAGRRALRRGAARARGRMAPPGPVARRAPRPRGAARRARGGDALQRPCRPARRPRPPRRPALRRRPLGRAGPGLQARARGLPHGGAPARRAARRAHARRRPPVGPRGRPQRRPEDRVRRPPARVRAGLGGPADPDADEAVGDLLELAERLAG